MGYKSFSKMYFGIFLSQNKFYATKQSFICRKCSLPALQGGEAAVRQCFAAGSIPVKVRQTAFSPGFHSPLRTRSISSGLTRSPSMDTNSLFGLYYF